MAAQVKEIRELSGTGHPADQIASMLGMDGQQVRDILVCMQSFPEDEPAGRSPPDCTGIGASERKIRQAAVMNL